MRIAEFISAMRKQPRWKVGSSEADAYREVLKRFPEERLEEIFDEVLRSCDFTPSIAAIYRAVGATSSKPYEKPPAIKTDQIGECEVCSGRGLVFRIRDGYEYLYRCSCPAGKRQPPAIPPAAAAHHGEPR